MLIEEAKWFGARILEIGAETIQPMLDIGSSTSHFREVEQPWIEHYVFRSFPARSGAVMHLDCKKDSGVDIVGDFTDVTWLTTLAQSGFRSIFCSNVLEHVPHRKALAKALVDILPAGGYIFASCPYEYPYHADPFDTMFRPDIAELSGLFCGTQLVAGEIVSCGSYWDYLKLRPINIVRTAARLAVPFYKPKGWLTCASHIPWLFKRFSATCVVLQKM